MNTPLNHIKISPKTLKLLKDNISTFQAIDQNLNQYPQVQKLLATINHKSNQPLVLKLTYEKKNQEPINFEIITSLNQNRSQWTNPRFYQLIENWTQNYYRQLNDFPKSWNKCLFDFDHNQIRFISDDDDRHYLAVNLTQPIVTMSDRDFNLMFEYLGYLYDYLENLFYQLKSQRSQSEELVYQQWKDLLLKAISAQQLDSNWPTQSDNTINDFRFDHMLVNNGQFLITFNLNYQNQHQIDQKTMTLDLNPEQFFAILTNEKVKSPLPYYVNHWKWNQPNQNHLWPGIKTNSYQLIENVETINKIYLPFCKSQNINPNDLLIVDDSLKKEFGDYTYRHNNIKLFYKDYLVNSHNDYYNLLLTTNNPLISDQQLLFLEHWKQLSDYVEVKEGFTELSINSQNDHVFELCDVVMPNKAIFIKWFINGQVEKIEQSEFLKMLETIKTTKLLLNSLYQKSSYFKAIKKFNNNKTVHHEIIYRDNEFYISPGMFRASEAILLSTFLKQNGFSQACQQLDQIKANHRRQTNAKTFKL